MTPAEIAGGLTEEERDYLRTFDSDVDFSRGPHGLMKRRLMAPQHFDIGKVCYRITDLGLAVRRELEGEEDGTPKEER